MNPADNSRDYALLLAASVPPPIAGQSIATEMLLEHLRAQNVRHEVVDLARPLIPTKLMGGLQRSMEAARLPFDLLRASSRIGAPTHRIFYLQLGQSPRSLLRDAPMLSIAAARKWPTVLHIHGGGFRAGYEAAPRAMRAFTARMIRRASRIVVLTESLRGMLGGLADPARVNVISNGVTNDVLEYCKGRHDAPRTGPIRVVYLSNLIETKGYVDVLRAALIAQEHGLDCEFRLAGSKTDMMGVDPDDFIRQNQLKNTRYLGPVHGEAKLKVLEESDVFVLPTRYPVEGQPISILEAMHFGLAIVACPAGGIADVVVDGVHGRLIRPGDAVAIVRFLQDIISDPAMLATIARTNSKHAKTSYTATRHGEQMVALFDSVRDEHRRPT